MRIVLAGALVWGCSFASAEIHQPFNGRNLDNWDVKKQKQLQVDRCCSKDV